MDEVANTIFKKMGGWWVSGRAREANLGALRGRSAAEIDLIRASYAEHFIGHDLDADLAKNLDGKDLVEAMASLSGDPVESAVAAIRNADTGTFFGGVDAGKVRSVLDGI